MSVHHRLRECRSAFHFPLPAVLALAIALFLAALPANLHAQYRASIQGVVSDPSGAVVPGVTLTLTDLATGKLLTTTTDSAGVYAFNGLPPDHFRLTAEMRGFRTSILDNLTLIPEQANAVNVQLQVGTATESVQVDASQRPPLDTETASINGTISANQITHMPSFGRDVTQLVQLAPGVFGDAAQSQGGGTHTMPGANSGSAGATSGIFVTENAPQVVANGSENNTNGIWIDGISTESAVWGGTTVITPTEESVESVKVTANAYDAEFGRFSGAQIQITSKSGSNNFHGSLFFTADRPGMNAFQTWNGPNSFSSGTAAQRNLFRDTARFNQEGGSVSGPVWKNKLFASFAYETIRNSSTTTGSNWYETPQLDKLAPAGSIAAKYLAFPGEGASYTAIQTSACTDIGLTEGPQCHALPGQGLDVGSPLKTALGTHDPTWTGTASPGVGSGLDGIADLMFASTSSPSQQTETQYYGRFDANATKDDRFSFTTYWVPVSTVSYNGPVRAANLWNHSQVNDAFTLLWDHTFSASLLNEARVNAAGWRWNEIASNSQEPFGLPQANLGVNGNVFGNGVNPQYFGAPGPSVFDQWTYGYQDVLTKVAGRHSIKTGFSLTRLYYLNEAPYSARPSFSFTNFWDFLNDAPHSESGNFNPATGTPTANREDNRQDLWAGFVQDDWKLRPNLTLNLGLRYSYFGPFSDKDGNLKTVVLGSGSSMMTGLTMRSGGNLATAQKGNFGPQIGFAWNPHALNQKMVLRGGFGLNYNQDEIAILANGIGNPGNTVGISFCCSQASGTTGSGGSILYNVASDVHSLFGYPSNPATITSFGSNGLPSNTATAVSVTGFDPHIKTIATYHYSLETEYDLGYNIVATLGYQGSTTHHQLLQQNMNAVAAVAGYALNPQVSSAGYYGNFGNASYNAMLLTLRHNFIHSFQGEAQYTWARSMDNGSQPYYQDVYPYNHALSWGRSDFDVQNAFKIYGLYQPTFFHDHLLHGVLDGWTLTGIYNLHTGFPWTPTVPVQGGSLYFPNSPYSSLRPAAYLGGAGHDLSNAAFKTGTKSSVPYNKNFSKGSLSYFALPTYKAVTTGTGPAPQAPGVARNSFDGPHYRDVDASLTKGFALPTIPGLGENARLEFRVDAFNLFNNLNLTNVNATVVNYSGGNPVSNPGFGQAQGSLGSRTLDMQARFSF